MTRIKSPQPMQAVVKKQYFHFIGVFDKGDIVNIEPVLYKKDTIIVNERPRTSKNSFSVPETIAPKGSYKNFRIKSKNGKTYSEECMRNAIGFISLDKIFSKI